MPQSSNNPFHIGLRTFKTAVSVFICVVLFRVLHRGSPMLAALSAIFSLRTDHQQTFKFAFSRFIGNTTGGVVAIILFYVRTVLPYPEYTDLLLAPVGIVIIILFCNRFNKTGVINSCATFLVIFFNIEAGQNTAYAIQRILDTLIGAVIAIGVNHILPNPHLKEEKKAFNLKGRTLFEYSLLFHTHHAVHTCIDKEHIILHINRLRKKNVFCFH